MSTEQDRGSQSHPHDDNASVKQTTCVNPPVLEELNNLTASASPRGPAPCGWTSRLREVLSRPLAPAGPHGPRLDDGCDGAETTGTLAHPRTGERRTTGYPPCTPIFRQVIPLSPTESIESRKSADGASESRGRGYTFAGVGLTVTLALIVVVGLAGVVGIGILSPGEAFFVLGAAMAVLSVAVAGLLFSMHRTLDLLKEQQATIDTLQDERFRAVSEEQGRTDRDQEDDIDQLQSQLADEDPSTNGRPGLATPFGDVHPVIDVEGIGEDFSPQLGKLDIEDTAQLWQADPDTVASALEIPRKTVRSWQRMAELMALQDVGPQYAELLVRARITSIEQLSEMTPADVAEAVQQAEGDREVRIQGNTIGEKHTKTWIEAARLHHPEGVQVQR